MKIKKTLVTFLVIAVICIFSSPSALFANGEERYEYTVTVEKTAVGFDSGEFTFWLFIFINGFFPIGSGIIGYEGGSVQINYVGLDLSIYSVFVIESGTNGATGVEVSLDSPPTAIDGIINGFVGPLSLSSVNTTETVYFDNIKVARPEPEPEPEPKPEPEPESIWVRTMPMTCWQVFINEDNMFEFIFWYPYKDNNWVRIYDMEGNIVYEVEVPVDDPNIIVDLPDGFYTVKTFHGEELLQEFLIGKP
jgi:hypothetical protein